MRIIMHLIEEVNRKGFFFAGYKNGTPVWTKYSVDAERWQDEQKAMKEAERIAQIGIPCKVVTDRRKLVKIFFRASDAQDGSESE